MGGSVVAAAREERLAVLRMVAAGTVTPEDALELLAALDPGEGAPAAGPVRDDGPVLRVHCAWDDRQFDFAIPASAIGDIAALLPQGAAARLPQRLLERLRPLVHAPGDDRLLRVEDPGDPGEPAFELTVTRIWNDRKERNGDGATGFGQHVALFRGR
jgi:hypothetical protein